IVLRTPIADRGRVMTIEELVASAPWLLAATIWILALIVCRRHVCPAVGLKGYQFGWSDGPQALAPTGNDALYDSFYEQLLALGFRPAGVTWEKVPGKRKIEASAFLHPKDAWRASIWRALGADFRIYFLPQFTDPGAVLTANYPRRVTRGPNYLA